MPCLSFTRSSYIGGGGGGFLLFYRCGESNTLSTALCAACSLNCPQRDNLTRGTLKCLQRGGKTGKTQVSWEGKQKGRREEGGGVGSYALTKKKALKNSSAK